MTRSWCCKQHWCQIATKLPPGYSACWGNVDDWCWATIVLDVPPLCLVGGSCRSSSSISSSSGCSAVGKLEGASLWTVRSRRRSDSWLRRPSFTRPISASNDELLESASSQQRHTTWWHSSTTWGWWLCAATVQQHWQRASVPHLTQYKYMF